MSLTLGELAEKLDCEVKGDPATVIAGIGPLSSAEPDCLSFLSHRRFARYLADTRAAAVIVKPSDMQHCPVNALISENPYAAYARAVALLYPQSHPEAGVDATSRVALDVSLPGDVCLGPNVVIEKGVSIGAGSQIGAGTYIGAGGLVGEGCRIMSNVSIYPGVRIGNGVIVHAGAVIGSDGFGFANDQSKWIKVPQIGGVSIGDDVEIGANTTIDRGALEDTVIERGVKLDNQIQVAHNVRLGEDTAIAGCVGIAGSAIIGKRCTIGGGSVILGHLSIVDDVHITAMSLVTGSVSKSGAYSSGTPLEENKRWRRNFVRHKQLDDMAQRITKLEKMLEAVGSKNK